MKRLKLIPTRKDENVTEVYEDQTVEFEPDQMYGLILKGSRDACLVDIRVSGEFAGKALCLDLRYDWAIGEDDMGTVIIVPTPKPKPLT